MGTVKKLSPSLRVLGLPAALGALLCFSSEIRQAGADSIVYCLTALAPSLFPFLVLTDLAVRSGFGGGGGPLGWAARHIFRLPAACGPAIALSFLGGYPAGAKTASLLLEQGELDEEQARRMMGFCVGPGAAFTVTFIGAGMFRSMRAGWLLFASVTLAGLLLGALTAFGKPLPPKKAQKKNAPAGGALIASVAGASENMLLMCGCIVLFAGISAALKAVGLYGLLCRGAELLPFLKAAEASALVSFLFEVTGGVGEAFAGQAGGPLFAFGLGFGGCACICSFSPSCGGQN